MDDIIKLVRLFVQFFETRRGAKTRAFTLIDLLITVAILTILAAIATPNFLQAQVRAKVARARADMRTIASGLETYVVDNNAYPAGGSFFDPMPSKRLIPLTTPVSYLSTPPRDPFLRRTGHNYEDSLKSVDAREPLDVYLYNLASHQFGPGEIAGKANQMSYSLAGGRT